MYETIKSKAENFVFPCFSPFLSLHLFRRNGWKIHENLERNFQHKQKKEREKNYLTCSIL